MNISPRIISLIDEIKKDRTHGASQLARQAVEVLKVAAGCSRADSVKEFLREQREIGERLTSARPAMAPLFNMVSIFLGALSREAARMNLAQVKLLAVAKADEAVRESFKAVAQIAENACGLISGSDRIMTHSYSSTVVAVLKKAFDEYPDISVVATRSGSGCGGDITARELGRYGIPVTFIDDIAAVNKVIIGADRVCADARIVNATGSYQLAIAAQRAEIAFYVVCERLKFDPRVRGDEADLEVEEQSEVIKKPGVLPTEVKVKNPCFDITPPELISGIISENGLLTPEEAISYMKKKSHRYS